MRSVIVRPRPGGLTLSRGAGPFRRQTRLPPMTCLFATDLHGDPDRYRRLFEIVAAERPAAVFLGGDLTPAIAPAGIDDFLYDVVRVAMLDLRSRLGNRYPRFFVIPGNDDGIRDEETLLSMEEEGLLTYMHLRRAELGDRPVLGCAFVPPTPFAGKDWERYDVSRHLPPGCVSPEDGSRSRPLKGHVIRHRTLAVELDDLAGTIDLADGICLFHSPPVDTHLDRAATDGMMIDHCPLDLHVGSVAIRRFIEERQPAVTLHGHIHESARITGSWMDRIGRTCCLGAAHDGPELALVAFDPENPFAAVRRLIETGV